MAGESNCVRVAVLTIMVAFFFIIPTPQVAATQSGVTIDGNSINLENFETTANFYYNLEFNLTATNQGSGQNFVGQIHFETSAIDGTLLSNSSINYSLEEGGVESIIYNFSTLSYGYTTISVVLSGDLGVESSNELLSFQRTIHRLKPLNVSIAASSSILAESVDSTGAITGNNSLSDGDYVQFQIPIINDGDYNWTGNITLVIDNGISIDVQTSPTLVIMGMNTQIVVFNSTIQVFEGLFSVSISLGGLIDDYIIDNYQNFTKPVNPPPLPLLSTWINYYDNELISGESLEIYLTNYNNGTVDFTGAQNCMLNDELVYNSTVDISSSTSETANFSVTIKPGELVCYFTGQRIDENSLNNISILFDVESALFEYAGSFSPSATDGPWHVGDDATFSLLVRNTGTKQGNVTLRMESSSENYQGNLVALQPDQAGEVTITVPLLNSGNEQFNWSLYTTDGEVEDGINGTISLPISVRQSLELSLYDISWTTEDGLTAHWSLNLSSGIDREINVKLGYGGGLQDIFVYDVDMLINEGQTIGSINFGFVDGDYVIIRVQEINWTAASSFTSFTKSIPQERPEYNMVFNSQSNPNRPTAGESASVSVSIQNQGNIDGSAGILIIYNKEDGTMLAETITPTLSAGSSQTITLSFAWPETDEVKLTAKWDYDGESKIVEQNFLSSITVQESKEEISIPWSGILGGLAISALIILAVRIKGDSNKQPRNKPKKQSSKPETTQLSDVKIEISCPVCSRQLRVPENYQGSVKCPDCSNSFEVGAGTEVQDEETESEIPDKEVPVKNDGKIEISCPECSQSLRIPESYEGSVRCPACKNVFSSS